LLSAEFAGAFQTVVFAVLDPLGTGNLGPFRREMAQLTKVQKHQRQPLQPEPEPEPEPESADLASCSSGSAGKQASVRGQALLAPLTGRESYVGPQDIVVVDTCPCEGGDVVPATATTLFWLAGSGQRPDNELLRRFVNSLHAVGLQLTVIGYHHRQRAEVAEACRRLAEGSTSGMIVVGGHSAGGGVAADLSARLLQRYPARVKGLITINGTAKPPPDSPPSLVVVGENDGGSALATGAGGFARGQLVLSVQGTVSPPRQGSSTVLLARHGDHSIRWCSADADAREKEAASLSDETLAMNRAVAAAVKQFLGWVGAE
jgi:pimeloyl-ACP methyl ester carboxylesterase